MTIKRIVFADEAADYLEAIWTYVAERAGEDVARAYIDRIVRRCRSLETFAMRGTPRDDLAPGARTVLFEGRATIVYRVSDDAVTIEAVAHHGRDLGSARDDD